MGQKMSGDGDGNLSDSSCSAVSGLSLRDGGNQRQLVNPNLNLSISSTSGDAHDPKTREILRLRAENADLKTRLQDIDDSSDDDDGQGNDANKSWSELGKRRKKQLLSNISREIGRLAQERKGVGNIAASVLARVTYRHNRSLSEVASQIEEGVNISQDRKVSVLVASWILVRGKGGGFGKRMYSSVARVFRGL